MKNRIDNSRSKNRMSYLDNLDHNIQKRIMFLKKGMEIRDYYTNTVMCELLIATAQLRYFDEKLRIKLWYEEYKHEKKGSSWSIGVVIHIDVPCRLCSTICCCNEYRVKDHLFSPYSVTDFWWSAFRPLFVR